MSVLMSCGHAANATNERGLPSCAICVGIHPGAENPHPTLAHGNRGGDHPTASSDE
jgi:hypothetical protein